MSNLLNIPCEVTITMLEIKSTAMQLDVLIITENGECYLFEKASRISMQQLSFPMKIGGFEIVDNRQNGWDADSRYHIRDFEDGILEFVCESIARVEIDQWECVV